MLRRQFLTQAFLGTTGLLIAKKSLADSFLQIEKCHCLVIGAGMAGVTAAKDLNFPSYSNRGYKTIVLEASNRVGGRIHSVLDTRFGGHVELGAEYLHRDPGSVALWKEIDSYKPKVIKIPRMRKGLVYDQGWEDHLRTQYMLAFEWNLYDLATFSRKIDNYKGPDISARQWLKRQNYSDFGNRMLDLFFTGHVPGNLDQISIKGFGADRITEQNLEENEYGFVGGYGNFVQQMTRGMNQYAGQKLDVRYGAVVSHIKYGPQGVEVRTQDGRRFQAKAVVLTASIGMLKSGEITFDPPLPQSKVDALCCLEMGDEAKVALKFKRRFWPEEAVFLNRIDKNHEMARTYFLPFSYDDGKNVVLSALFAGDEADKIRNMKDIEVIKALCRDLDKMFPRAAPTFNLLARTSGNNLIYHRSQWSQDPFAKGADSYLKFGTERSIPVTKARQVLANPSTTPGLFWAGEATAYGDFTQPCSTHGAHFSGARAAREVDKFIRMK